MIDYHPRHKMILAIVAALVFVSVIVIPVIMATNRGGGSMTVAPTSQPAAPTARKEILSMVEQTNIDPREQPVQTARLVLRRFTREDWKELQQLAVDKKNTGGDRYDHAWPTDDKGAQEMAQWCVGQRCFAVCLKDSGKLIGFVRFNSIDDQGQLDLGHMFHSRYRGERYASEAIRPLLAVAFADPKVKGIVARNAVEWPGQLTPLIELGFRELERGQAPNFNGAEGGPTGFVGCRMGLTRTEWEASTAEDSRMSGYGALRHIREINPFQKELEIFYLPASRVIGVEQTYGPEPGGDRAAAPQWGRVIASKEWKAIQALPRVIPRSGFGWTCDYKPEAKTFQYLVAVLTPAGTAVPEGCQFRDVPPTLVAAGRWDEPMDQVVERMKQLGYVSRWGDKGCSWNAELYLREEEQLQEQGRLPTPNGQEWRWLIPIKEADFKLSDHHPCHVILPAFEVIGFTKIVASGGEQYGEVRGDGRWEQLRRLGGDDPTIYGVASHDKECPQGKHRYTVGVKATDALRASTAKPDSLFSLSIPESDWLVFRLNFKGSFGQLWQDDPYRIVKQLGWEFNTKVNLHTDVFGPAYVTDGVDDFEFWMPVKRP